MTSRHLSHPGAAVLTMAAASLVLAATCSLPSATAHPSPRANAPSHCREGQLGVHEGGAGAATGHIGIPIRFRNRSHRTCSLRGYPGAAGLNKHGKQVDPGEAHQAGLHRRAQAGASRSRLSSCTPDRSRPRWSRAPTCRRAHRKHCREPARPAGHPAQRPPSPSTSGMRPPDCCTDPDPPGGPRQGRQPDLLSPPLLGAADVQLSREGPRRSIARNSFLSSLTSSRSRAASSKCSSAAAVCIWSCSCWISRASSAFGMFATNSAACWPAVGRLARHPRHRRLAARLRPTAAADQLALLATHDVVEDVGDLLAQRLRVDARRRCCTRSASRGAGWSPRSPSASTA